jgi:WD40 repeat protein
LRLQGGVYGLAWSPDGSRFITASADKTVKLWDAAANSLLTTFTFPDEVDFQQLGCHWQGEHLISLGLNGELNFLDLTNPSQPKRKLQVRHEAAVGRSQCLCCA